MLFSLKYPSTQPSFGMAKSPIRRVVAKKMKLTNATLNRSYIRVCDFKGLRSSKLIFMFLYSFRTVTSIIISSILAVKTPMLNQSILEIKLSSKQLITRINPSGKVCSKTSWAWEIINIFDLFSLMTTLLPKPPYIIMGNRINVTKFSNPEGISGCSNIISSSTFLD